MNFSQHSSSSSGVGVGVGGLRPSGSGDLGSVMVGSVGGGPGPSSQQSLAQGMPPMGSSLLGNSSLLGGALGAAPGAGIGVGSSNGNGGGINLAALSASAHALPNGQASSAPVSIGGVGSSSGSGAAVGPAPATPTLVNANTIDELHLLVLQLTDPERREGVLLELSKKRESFPDLAPILWHTFGTVAALLQEIVSIYPLLTPPTLTAHASNRVCNALALLQCVASHPDTRGLFLSAHVPLYLYPFLNTNSKSRPFEYLRLTSLGVIGALVKMDDADVINFLLQTEIIPLCLRIMEAGSELSKTVATFIVQKILLDEIGLSYVCATAERFYAVSTVLNNMIGCLVLSPSVRLLKHIVRCYLRLSDNARARDALRQALPPSLRDDTFGNALRDDVTVKKWLSQLLSVVGPPVEGNGGGGAPNGGGGGAPNNQQGGDGGGGRPQHSVGMPPVGGLGGGGQPPQVVGMGGIAVGGGGGPQQALFAGSGGDPGDLGGN